MFTRKEGFEDRFKKLKATVGGIKDNVEDNIDDVSDAITDKIEDTLDDIKDVVSDKIEDIIEDRISDAKDVISDKIKDKIEDIRDVIEDIEGKIKFIIVRVKNKLEELEDKIEDVKDTLEDVADTIEDFKDRIEDRREERKERREDRRDELKQKVKILFILKRRGDYGDHESYSKPGVSSGLWNSARLVSEMLTKNGVASKMVEVVDNNSIDREVTLYKPTHVIIEALWVVPSKFDILSKRHPKVKWIIRLHSETPFIANEGMAFEWIRDYAKHPNVLLSANADRMLKETRFLVAEQRGLNKQQAKDKVVFLPNYYLPEDDNPRHENPDSDIINVGCFGAIRPLKNHMIQAVAALMFAKELDKKLHFHINIGRSEMKGTPILKNLIGMFDGLKEQGHVLHLHQWMPHSEFLEVVKTMDIGLQVSFTETFNIVAADLVACGIPTVVSKEISWMFPYYADPVCSDDIARKLNVTWLLREKLPCANKVLLKDYAENSEKIWVKYFTS